MDSSPCATVVDPIDADVAARAIDAARRIRLVRRAAAEFLRRWAIENACASLQPTGGRFGNDLGGNLLHSSAPNDDS